MERKSQIDLTGAVALVTFSALMGLNQALIAIVNSGFSPIFQAGLRSAVALPAVLIFALILKKRLRPPAGAFGPGLLCGVFFSVEFMLLFQAIELTSVSRASVLFYTMPIWVAAAAHVFIPGERLTPVRILGLVLAICGVAAALLLDDPAARAGSFTGDMMALAGSFLWTAIAMTARTTKLSAASPETQLVFQLAVSAPLLIGLAAMLGETVREPTVGIAAIFLFQALVVVAGGFLTWFWVLSVYPASDMASFGFLAPVFGVLAGWLLLDEPLSPSILIALALVGAGIVLVNRPRPKT